MKISANYKPSGGSSQLPGGGSMKRPPIPGFPASGSGSSSGYSSSSYGTGSDPSYLDPLKKAYNADYLKPQNYNAVNVQRYTPDKTDYVGQAYKQVSNTGGLQGLYNDIFKNTQRLDPYGSGLSSEAATQAMMNTAMGYVMPYAGQLSGQGFQGNQNYLNQLYGANVNAQNLTAGSYNNAMGTHAGLLGQYSNLAQNQNQWGQNFNAQQAAQDQAQANWQAQFDRQGEWYDDSQKIANKPAAGGGGTNFVGGMPSFGFPAGAGGLPGSPSSSNPWNPYPEGQIGGGVGQWHATSPVNYNPGGIAGYGAGVGSWGGSGGGGIGAGAAGIGAGGGW